LGFLMVVHIVTAVPHIIRGVEHTKGPSHARQR
jgi:hypothetical protein